MRNVVARLAAVAVLALGGCAGESGRDGGTGPQGPAGVDGQQGPKGDPGQDGSDGNQGPKGDPGDPGDPGQDGKDGVDGQDGQDGQDGNDGKDGKDAPIPTGAGLKIDLQSATVVAGQAPTVTFRIADAEGLPIAYPEDWDGQLRFTIAYMRDDLKMETYAPWVSSVAAKTYAGAPSTLPGPKNQVGYDPPRSVTPYPYSAFVAGAEPGVYTYTFASALPSSIFPSRTHYIGVWASRTVDEVAYPAGDTLRFVPDGGSAISREIVTDAACNSCHGTLRAHGSRQGVDLCVTCHNDQTADPESGNPVDMKYLVHKIHMGERLPSSEDANAANDFFIVGFNQTIFRVGDILLPPSASSYMDGGKDTGLVRDCAMCHQGKDAGRSFSAPSRAACFACHDDINVETGAGHPLAAQSNDANCVVCHAAGGAQDPVKVHDLDYDTETKYLFPARTFQITIVDVANVGPNLQPQVTFDAKLDGQPYDVIGSPTATAGLSAFGFVAKPTDGIDQIGGSSGPASLLLASPPAAAQRGADPAKVAAVSGTPGRFIATLAALPANASGTWAFGAEAIYYDVNQNGTPSDTTDDTRRPAATLTPLVYKAVTGDLEKPYVVVSNDSCNDCHQDLGFHSNRSRKGVEYCETCHNPLLDNRGRIRFQQSQLAQVFEIPAGFLVESVNIGIMSHKIHMGEELTNPYVLGAVRTASMADPNLFEGGSGLSDFSHKAFPNRMGRCDTCHVAGKWALPEGEDLQPVRRAVMTCAPGAVDANGWCTTRSVVRELQVPRQTAVCSSCHDDEATLAHALQNTWDIDDVVWNGNEMESCAVCHGAGAVFDSLEVHTGLP